MPSKPEHPTWGGRREPAGGRPPLPAHLRRVRVGFMRLPGWLVAWLKAQDEPAGNLVERALKEAYGLQEPGEESEAK